MGKAIYLGYDRAALDAQYNNRLRVPDFATYFARWKSRSEAARRQLGAEGARLDVAYGPSALEKLDIFPAKATGGAKPPIWCSSTAAIGAPWTRRISVTRPRRTFRRG